MTFDTAQTNWDVGTEVTWRLKSYGYYFVDLKTSFINNDNNTRSSKKRVTKE